MFRNNPLLLGGSLLMLAFLTAFTQSQAQDGKRDLYELKIYHLETAAQEKMVDDYLESAFIPAAHRAGVSNVGVFKPLASEADAGKKIYLLLPFKNSKEYFQFQGKLDKDQAYQAAGKSYIFAAHDQAPFVRLETLLLQAFTGSPRMATPSLTGPKSERVYELRSYEAATERLYRQKVKMFNSGEIDIFDRLNFNPVFYAETLAGANMPNLVYMTTFENKADRDAHWDAFRVDPDWEAMKDLEEYRNTVSKNDTRLLYPTEYSDF
ncbi:NIPSNAP protein [Cyclobacterium xiamenense]|uniref:NIPSNAP protein n=1 Tax=Cyclobacterium xiamenense TaxID=1297121 RepID=A0A1H6T2K6_9BACT|nr:NIPSNAP family protein [Cyclobacterium xiamenense]SEI73466.1 NIPSNAP protein [Cyclobacterium xiamenense]